jgi:stress-induced-phosphoprotein 1
MHDLTIFNTNRAAALFNTKEFMKSASASATALQLDPNFTKGYVRFGRALAALKQYTAAIEEYDKALQLEPNQPIVIKYRQEALEKKQQSV